MSKKADDSPQVKKYRKKLEESISEEKKLINPESIQKMRNSIHKWINAHSKERIPLKHKSIGLFDEKTHPAIPKNKFILKLQSNLKKNPEKTLSKLNFKATIL